MPRNATYNMDGTTVGYGSHTIDDNQAGEAGNNGEKLVILRIPDATKLLDAATPTGFVAGQAPVIPAGAVITRAHFAVYTAFTGASAVLDIGGMRASDGTTADDDDGIDSAIAVASLTDSTVFLCDGAYISDATGGTASAVLANDIILYASYDTAVFTAGAGALFVWYVEAE